MNEQVKAFLMKASTDAALRAKLDALASLPKSEVAEKAAAIAREAGFDLTTEDFAPAGAELDEGELSAVAGGNDSSLCTEVGRDAPNEDFTCGNWAWEREYLEGW